MASRSFLNRRGGGDKVDRVWRRFIASASPQARRAAQTGRRLAAQADAARDAGSPATAAALYAQALAAKPDEAGLHIQCGHMLKDVGRLDEARRHYEQARIARPGDADLALQIGHLEKLAGRFLEAARAYDRAAELAPGWPVPVAERAALGENGWRGAPQLRSLDAIRARIAASGLFEADVYRDLNPDLSATSLTMLDHFVMIGVRERRRPHPLFDVDHYLKAYPDVGRQAANPLDDFLEGWARHRRDPNPFFDTAWYLAENPDVPASGLDPLSHYVRIGAARGSAPSPVFDPAFYSADDPDVASTGLEPLEHYLRLGRQDGRRINAAQARPGPSVPVTDAAIRCLKDPHLSAETALVVAHAPAGRLKPHVPALLDALARQGVAAVLVVACDGPLEQFDDPAAARAAGLYVRDNAGYDFAAWAHALRLCPALYGVERLILMNDSLFGPTNDADFGRMLAGVRASPAALVGATECFERMRHIQSFFLALTGPALRGAAFRAFMEGVVAYADKDDVIVAYECRLAQRMRAAGLACATLFEPGGRRNPTLFHWRGLLDQGFPFLKVSLVRDRIEGVDSSGWRAALEAGGYDTGLVDATLAAATPPFTAEPDRR